MDFHYPAEAEAFRSEYRTWLAANLGEDLRGVGFRGDPDPDHLDRLRDWNRRLDDAGYAAIAWPAAFGGRDASVMEQVVQAEENEAAGAPPPLNPIGMANIAPSIMAFGTPGQQRRFLGPMRRGDEIWCQGFSEPGAGSDLASLRTTAEPTGEGWRVNGQKVWTTWAQHSRWCELLVRTEPGADRPHRGISALLLDMSLPGIEVRPLRTATGGADFCELFLTDVMVPTSALLGDEHDGWTVAMATLGFERGGVASLHLQLRRRIRELLEAARRDGRTDDPLLRQQLARLHTRGETLRFLADRAVSAAARGGPPGAESSLVKVLWSLVGREVAETAAAVSGTHLTAWAGPDGQRADELVASVSLTIAGGTTEVNRNIIGERVLGLPREPRA